MTVKMTIIWIPKYRKKSLFGMWRAHLGGVSRELAAQKESKILEGHLLSGYAHMFICVPPKYKKIGKYQG